MNREILVRSFFFAALLFLLAQLYAILSGFLKPIAWSILLAIVFQPVHAWLLRATRDRASLAALLLTIAILLLVAVPAIGLSGVLAREGSGFVSEISRLSESGAILAWAQGLADTRIGRIVRHYVPWLASFNVDIASMARAGITAGGNAIVGQLGGLARNLASLVLQLFVVIFSLFFFLRDGERMLNAVRTLIPMQEGDKERVLARLRGMIEAVVRGMVVTAALQGILTGVGLAISRVPYASFLATLSALLSLFPFGAGLVWMGCTVYLFAIGEVGYAIFLLLWGALVVSSVDNFVRPILIGGQARISTLALFFGMIGGLEAYGFLGLFVGPAVMACLSAFVELYREEYVGDEPPRQLP